MVMFCARQYLPSLTCKSDCTYVAIASTDQQLGWAKQLETDFFGLRQVEFHFYRLRSKVFSAEPMRTPL
jgi:hypothetical protein